MKTKIRICGAFFALTLAAGAARAEQWNVLGPRAMAMGGAGVALDNGAVGDYWNPASLASGADPSGFQMPLGAHVNVSGDVLQGANNLKNILSTCGNNGLGSAICYAANSGNMTDDLNAMTGSGNGLVGDLGVGTDFKFGHAAVFVNELGYFGAQGELNGATATSLANNAQNTSKTTASPTLNLRGIGVTEVGLGYGHEIPWVPGLSVGGNLKALLGYAAYDNACMVSNAGVTNAAQCNGSFSGDSKLSFSQATKESFAPGLDLGALWDASKAFPRLPFHPRVGLTARDINNPTFKEPQTALNTGGPSEVALNASVRAGVAVSPFHWWNIDADVDLTRNTTFVDGLLYQMAGIGTEINIFNRPWINIAIRGGMAENLAMSSADPLLTAGFGLNIFHVMADFGAQLDPHLQYLQTQGKTTRIPSDLAVSAQLGFMFGGAK